MSGTRKGMVRIVVMMSIAAITACAGIAQADPGACGCEKGDKHQRHDFKKMADKLGLTDAQKVQAQAIFQGNKDVVKPLFTSMHTEKQNLQALIHADTTDEAAIRAETARIAGIEADLNINRAKVETQFRAILTPAQLATLKTLPLEHPGKGCAPPPPVE
jgi:Spy/CpxP family protein refolding chaperone